MSTWKRLNASPLLAPTVVYAVGLALLVVFSVFAVDHGPFEWGLSGSELIPWQVSLDARQDGTGASPVTGAPRSLYGEILRSIVDDGPGAVVRARRILAATCLPLYSVAVLLLAWPRSGPWAAVVAGWAAVVVGPSVVQARSISPGIPVAILGLYVLVLLDRRAGYLAWIVAGALTGVTIHLEATLGWSFGLLLVGLGLLRPGTMSRAGVSLTFLGACAMVTLITSRATHTEVLLPTPSAIEIYRGHGVDASGVNPRRSAEGELSWWSRRDFAREASRQRHKPTTATEAATYWTLRGIREALTHPLHSVRIAGVKLIATYQGDVLPGDLSLAFLAIRCERPGLSAVGWIGRILLPLGLVGLVLRARAVGSFVWVGALSGLMAALLTYAQPETRQMTVASLLVAASVLGKDLFTTSSWRRRTTALLGMAVAVGAWGFLPSHGGVPGLGVNAEDHLQLAALYDREGRGSAALREYERAARLEPTSPSPSFAVAGMLARDHVFTEAIKELESLRQRHPDFHPGLESLARLYEQQGRWTDAAASYAAMIELDPWNPEPRNNLGTIYARIGFFEEAARALKSAIEVDPRYEIARENLAGLEQRAVAGASPPPTAMSTIEDAQRIVFHLIRVRDLVAAEAALRNAYERFGAGRSGLKYAEGTLRLVAGAPDRAIPLFDAIYDSLSRDLPYLNNFAAAHAAAGNPCEAIRLWREALLLYPENARIKHSLLEVESAADSTDVDCGL